MIYSLLLVNNELSIADCRAISTDEHDVIVPCLMVTLNIQAMQQFI